MFYYLWSIVPPVPFSLFWLLTRQRLQVSLLCYDKFTLMKYHLQPYLQKLVEEQKHQALLHQGTLPKQQDKHNFKLEAEMQQNKD